MLETGPWGNKSGLTAVQPRGGNGPVAVGNISLKLPEVISISVLVKNGVHLQDYPQRIWDKKEMWAEERPPRGHEQFSVVGRSGSRTSSEARLWWKSVEEKISGRERSVVRRVARFSKIKNVHGSCTVAIRRHWEAGGEQALW